MEKRIKPECKTKVIPGGERIFWFTITDDLVPEWTMFLAMLRFRIIDAILLEVNQKETVRIVLEPNLNKKIRNIRGRATRISGGFLVEITEEELEYWLDFFLRYVRDGKGAVDHIDFETRPMRGWADAIPLDLVFTVTKTFPPISPEEFRRSFFEEEQAD